jgi:hypothetical protein
VNDPLPVGVFQPRGYSACDLDRLGDRQLCLTLEPLAQRLSFHEWHGKEKAPAGRAGVIELENVRVGKAGGDRDLTLETLGAKCRGKLRSEQFDRDLAMEQKILGQVDRGHTPTAELTLDRIATLESGSQLGELICHGGLTWGTSQS